MGRPVAARGCDAIIACGIPAAAVNGFRTPFLSDKKEVRAVLAENGFRYDSTIGAKGGANRVWPGVMSNGVGFDCSVAGQQCAASERYPNLWQVPLYEAPDENLMDYCTDEATGKPRPSCSALRQLQYMFDTAYKGNRGPVSVGVHSPYLTKSSYSKDLKKFFKYALGQQKKDVWAVTMNQLLDWMENPVPASRMSKFMKKYKCVE
ncbi:hypothetical protein CHLNCDRAFT_141534 [Chlorella variabilis]|uniref:NodB homology domain-containing protein n=1 Tax=Chlorella variabilis TaxID=554065 RepID=E1ZT23_CHLVA|nr:hypothetical protein CHLNCDRAFT_141534 [Chlorella variabilis]EFN51005.1 hypothetical protein CHLNCDRAFT_141534 [Chlorella variabilis]|eukprot:XP_005843107.1 hypothetical protein CHLNCDRAFT_141534 [Chlorella variabilis]